MKSYFKMAWRNIWRNKRRTLITAASVFFAVFFALVMSSIQTGTYSNMIDNVVQAYTGYVQIHKKGFWDDRQINNSFTDDGSLLRTLTSIKYVTVVVPRLESFALASCSQQTKIANVIGIDPGNEIKLTRLNEKIVKGKFLKENDNGVLASQKLAKFLSVNVNDTLVLIGQGYHGVTAADKFPVRCILHFPSPELDNQMIYMDIHKAQSFYSTGNRLTSISLGLRDQRFINEVAKEIKTEIGPGYEVMKWDEMLVELVQFIKAKSTSGELFIFILYLIVAFGIVGTILMMTAERIREFGMMVALGMQKKKLKYIIFIEIVFIGLIGIISGTLVSFPIIYYYHFHPIRLTGFIAGATDKYGFEPLMCFALQADFYIRQVLVVTIMIFFAAIYPLRKISKLKIIGALRTKT